MDFTSVGGNKKSCRRTSKTSTTKSVWQIKRMIKTTSLVGRYYSVIIYSHQNPFQFQSYPKIERNVYRKTFKWTHAGTQTKGRKWLIVFQRRKRGLTDLGFRKEIHHESRETSLKLRRSETPHHQGQRPATHENRQRRHGKSNHCSDIKCKSHIPEKKRWSSINHKL